MRKIGVGISHAMMIILLRLLRKLVSLLLRGTAQHIRLPAADGVGGQELESEGLELDPLGYGYITPSLER